MKNREDEISSEGVLALIYLPNFRGWETLERITLMNKARSGSLPGRTRLIKDGYW